MNPFFLDFWRYDNNALNQRCVCLSILYFGYDGFRLLFRSSLSLCMSLLCSSVSLSDSLYFLFSLYTLISIYFFVLLCLLLLFSVPQSLYFYNTCQLSMCLRVQLRFKKISNKFECENSIGAPLYLWVDACPKDLASLLVTKKLRVHSETSKDSCVPF